jgi:hypothetical protein
VRGARLITAHTGRRLAAALGAGLVLLATTATPAFAHSTALPGQLTVDCVVAGEQGTYRAVFGYDNSSQYEVTVPVGTYNSLSPSYLNLNGIQTTTFQPGAHRATFTTPALSRSESVRWTVGPLSVTASWNSRSCGPQVSLPADGNGTGPVFVIGASVALALIVLRSRRRKEQVA